MCANKKWDEREKTRRDWGKVSLLLFPVYSHLLFFASQFFAPVSTVWTPGTAYPITISVCACMFFFCLAFPHQVWQDHAHLHAWQNPFIPSVPHILNIRLFHKTHERSTPILASSWFTNRAKFIWVFLANNSYLQHKHGVGKLKRDSLGLINKEWRMINIIGYGKKIRQRLSSALPRFCWKRGSVYQVSGWNF